MSKADTLQSVYDDYAIDPSFAELRREGSGKLIPGQGHLSAKIAFVGEAPGATEDREGRPFCGRSGRLLDQALLSINLTRAQVFVTNVVKYRPKDNRPPYFDEAHDSRVYLLRELRIVQPELIVTLGAFALRAILPSAPPIGVVHGRRLSSEKGRPVVPMYHPSYVLRRQDLTDEYMVDFQQIRSTMDFIGVGP